MSRQPIRLTRRGENVRDTLASLAAAFCIGVALISATCILKMIGF
jgi:hypothetical protein